MNSMQAGIRPRYIQEDEIEQRLMMLYRAHPNEGLRLLLNRYTGSKL